MILFKINGVMWFIPHIPNKFENTTNILYCENKKTHFYIELI